MTGWLTPVVDPRARPRRSWVFDVLVTLAVIGLSLPEALFGPTPTGLAVLVTLLACLPVVLRRVWPLPVFAWTIVVTLALGWVIEQAVWSPALVVGVYTVALLTARKIAIGAAIALEIVSVVAAIERAGAADAWAPLIPLTAVTVGAVSLGLYFGARRALLSELQERAGRLERERDQEGALAAAAERARIAREMHDIVAHHLTVMVALSDGAAATSGRSPEAAAEVMRTVSATGRQALADTRRLLGVLRSDDETADRRPLPDLSDLDGLLERVRAAGLPVRYEVSGESVTVPSGVQLTLFRLVQEALTNTMKHGGPGASATVRLQYASDALRVDVEDDGAGGPGGRSEHGVGRGLSGMRERVSAFGGEVRTGPRSGRPGWQVHADVPLESAR